MLVISMSDFLGNPSQYMERAQHTSILVKNAGEKPVKLSASRPNFFIAFTNLFKPKTRKFGTLANKGSVEFIGDWEVTPEELFDNDETESYSVRK